MAIVNHFLLDGTSISGAGLETLNEIELGITNIDITIDKTLSEFSEYLGTSTLDENLVYDPKKLNRRINVQGRISGSNAISTRQKLLKYFYKNDKNPVTLKIRFSTGDSVDPENHAYTDLSVFPNRITVNDAFKGDFTADNDYGTDSVVFRFTMQFIIGKKLG